LHGYSPVLESFNIDYANQVSLISRIGRYEIRIGDRRPTANCQIEKPTLAEKNYFTTVTSETTGQCRITHGDTPGEIVEIRMDKTQLDPFTYADSQGDVMNSQPMVPLPVSDAQGDDEIKIIFR